MAERRCPPQHFDFAQRGDTEPEAPFFFIKWADTVVGDGATIDVAA